MTAVNRMSSAYGETIPRSEEEILIYEESIRKEKKRAERARMKKHKKRFTS